MVLSNVHSNRVGIILFLLVLLLLVPRAAGSQEAKVYSNTIGTVSNYQKPGAGIFVSDDVTLPDSASVTKVEILTTSSGASPYTVTVSLIAGDPCVGTPPQIPFSSKVFPGILPGNPEVLIATYSPTLRVPANFSVKVVFTDSNAGWAVAEVPEMGSSADRICVDQTGGGGNPGYLNLGSLEASMWIEIWADASTPVLPRSWGLLKERYLDP